MSFFEASSIDSIQKTRLKEKARENGESGGNIGSVPQAFSAPSNALRRRTMALFAWEYYPTGFVFDTRTMRFEAVI
jgi:hypothetical protein